MKERKNLRSFSKIYLLARENDLAHSRAFRESTENRLVYFFGPVGSLMLRDSDYVCDGEYGNSENVSLL